MMLAEQIYLVMGAVLVDQVVDRVEVAPFVNFGGPIIGPALATPTVNIVGSRGFYAGGGGGGGAQQTLGSWWTRWWWTGRK